MVIIILYVNHIIFLSGYIFPLEITFMIRCILPDNNSKQTHKRFNVKITISDFLRYCHLSVIHTPRSSSTDGLVRWKALPTSSWLLRRGGGVHGAGRGLALRVAVRQARPARHPLGRSLGHRGPLMRNNNRSHSGDDTNAFV